MAKRTKLTNSSDETEITSLISGDSVFTIPYFQRPYKWKPDKLKQLNLDILNIIDDSDSHFLGAIIPWKALILPIQIHLILLMVNKG